MHKKFRWISISTSPLHTNRILKIRARTNFRCLPKLKKLYALKHSLITVYRADRMIQDVLIAARDFDT